LRYDWVLRRINTFWRVVFLIVITMFFVIAYFYLKNNGENNYRKLQQHNIHLQSQIEQTKKELQILKQKQPKIKTHSVWYWYQKITKQVLASKAHLLQWQPKRCVCHDGGCVVPMEFLVVGQFNGLLQMLNYLSEDKIGTNMVVNMHQEQQHLEMKVLLNAFAGDKCLS